MPSQSRLEGESTLDHWTRTESPDLDRILGLTDTVTCDDVDDGGRVRKRKRMKRGCRRDIDAGLSADCGGGDRWSAGVNFHEDFFSISSN